jgi:hypothetical protein
VNQKLHIGGVDPDVQCCLRCGSDALDTGWECNGCGYDNMPHYVEPTALATTPKEPRHES